MTAAEDANVACVVVEVTCDADVVRREDWAVGLGDDTRRVNVNASVELRRWRWRRGRNREYANVKQPELAEKSTHVGREWVHCGTE